MKNKNHLTLNKFLTKKFLIQSPFILGIGREVVQRLYDAGAIVYALSLETMEDLKEALPNVHTVSLDLADWSKAREILGEVFKDVEIDGGLVNNAGITICKPFEELTEADYDKYIKFLFFSNFVYSLRTAEVLRICAQLPSFF